MRLLPTLEGPFLARNNHSEKKALTLLGGLAWLVRLVCLTRLIWLTRLTRLTRLELLNRDRAMEKKLRITDVVRLTGLGKSTIIRYEKEGKLPRAKRDGRNWRFYTQADCDLILKRLKKLKLI
jgi:predicted DNA-binding transcriptional regulator AlpA